MLAVANAYDRLTTAVGAERRDRRAAVEELITVAGELWEPRVLDALARVVAVPPRRRRRRRQADALDVPARETDAA